VNEGKQGHATCYPKPPIHPLQFAFDSEPNSDAGVDSTVILTFLNQTAIDSPSQGHLDHLKRQKESVFLMVSYFASILFSTIFLTCISSSRSAPALVLGRNSPWAMGSPSTGHKEWKLHHPIRRAVPFSILSSPVNTTPEINVITETDLQSDPHHDTIPAANGSVPSPLGADREPGLVSSLLSSLIETELLGNDPTETEQGGSNEYPKLVVAQ
jgi:hypothetical protein